MPGTTVALPRTAVAGSTVQGKAPPGSVVHSGDERIIVNASGLFEIGIPDRPGGRLAVRIERPSTTAMTLQITITTATP